MSRIFASFAIAKGFAAASILTVVASAPASAQLKWDLSTAPMQYLQYELPYYKLAQIAEIQLRLVTRVVACREAAGSI